MLEQALGIALTRVDYWNLADAAWEITPGMHRLDFGVDLTFGPVTVGVTWSSPGQRLDVQPLSIGPSLSDAVDVDVSGTYPWSRIVGRPLHAVVGRHAEGPSNEVGGPFRWAVACRFEESATVWLAAANYLDPPGVLLPFGDELIVIHDLAVANQLGLEV